MADRRNTGSRQLNNYDDIIHLPHHVSEKHMQMSIHDRSAQFAPFAALNGYGEEVDETARLTESRVDLDENRKEIMDEKLMALQEHIKENPEVTITFFVPDEKKSGGKYLTEVGVIKKIDSYNHKIIMQNGLGILIEDMYDIESEIFDSIYE